MTEGLTENGFDVKLPITNHSVFLILLLSAFPSSSPNNLARQILIVIRANLLHPKTSFLRNHTQPSPIAEYL